MKTTINSSAFVQAFSDYGREDQFTYAALVALYAYITELEEDCGEQVELDVIALCCEFSEYESFEEIQENYADIETLEDLYDHTQVIQFNGGIIIQDF